MGKPAQVGAVVLAAGASRRMGQPKMGLPFRGSTVLGTVLTVLDSAGIQQKVVVIGGAKEKVEMILSGLPFAVTRAYNPDFESTEMLHSLQIGMRFLSGELDAFFITLGDQPQIDESIVRALMDEYQRSGSALILPSYQMRRGHPWLVARPFWQELLELPAASTLRDFLNRHQNEMHYLAVENPAVLADLDTPDDYRRISVE
jgi:molybdenum cofactor cytidylyltransferase